ncbi:unnamed protein product [Polarella glacialis]|uniref:Uncharacterized protein n=1 Tax=Polarella glacialis TaxID=89957 RepID=A0A813EFV2_POLGL|nr:unnamed protein product [Polarella glacialis]
MSMALAANGGDSESARTPEAEAERGPRHLGRDSAAAEPVPGHWVPVELSSVWGTFKLLQYDVSTGLFIVWPWSVSVQALLAEHGLLRTRIVAEASQLEEECTARWPRLDKRTKLRSRS